MLERRDCDRGDRPVSVASIRGPAYTAPGKLWARASFTVRSWSAGETSSANRASPSAASECGLDGFRNAAVRHLHRRGENRRLNVVGHQGFK